MLYANTFSDGINTNYFLHANGTCHYMQFQGEVNSLDSATWYLQSDGRLVIQLSAYKCAFDIVQLQQRLYINEFIKTCKQRRSWFLKHRKKVKHGFKTFLNDCLSMGNGSFSKRHDINNK
ncbi:MAG: hypothetical protein ABJA78_15900 [Ferruginibacter sp.]